MHFVIWTYPLDVILSFSTHPTQLSMAALWAKTVINTIHTGPPWNSSSPFDPYLIFLPFLPSILDMLDLLTLPCPDNGVIIMPVTAGERKQSLFFNICHMLGNIFSFSKWSFSVLLFLLQSNFFFNPSKTVRDKAKNKGLSPNDHSYSS